MKLERKWARLSIVLLLPALFSLVQLVLYDALIVQVISVLWAVLFFIASMAVRLIGLRCTHCGKHTCPPRWNPGKRFYCPNCGEPFVFDDEEAGR